MAPKSADSLNYSQLYTCSSGPCDVLKEYFGNFPMRNDGTCPRRNPFHITETQMAIQTEVTLQPDYTCCLRVMGEKSRIAEIVI